MLLTGLKFQLQVIEHCVNLPIDTAKVFPKFVPKQVRDESLKITFLRPAIYACVIVLIFN